MAACPLRELLARYGVERFHATFVNHGWGTLESISRIPRADAIVNVILGKEGTKAEVLANNLLQLHRECQCKFPLATRGVDQTPIPGPTTSSIELAAARQCDPMAARVRELLDILANDGQPREPARPPGNWAPSAPGSSHMWPKFSNLTWENEKAEKRGRQPDDPIVRVRVPLPKRNRSQRRPGAIEICCGHAGLTAALCAAGLDAVGVDWKGNRHQTCVPVLQVDLTTKDGQQFVRELVEQTHVVYVHLAPPCGTYSRARERPIPAHLRRRNAPCPRPLRTDDQPEGIGPDDLTAAEAVKVEKGNLIANFCAEIGEACLRLGKWFSIKNPASSIIWLMPAMQQLLANDTVTTFTFHSCMWGGNRKKNTAFVTNMPGFRVLEQEGQCDGSHIHAPWGVRWCKETREWKFATADECE